jgi:hypothetical protein
MWRPARAIVQPPNPSWSEPISASTIGSAGRKSKDAETWRAASCATLTLAQGGESVEGGGARGGPWASERGVEPSGVAGCRCGCVEHWRWIGRSYLAGARMKYHHSLPEQKTKQLPSSAALRFSCECALCNSWHLRARNGPYWSLFEFVPGTSPDCVRSEKIIAAFLLSSDGDTPAAIGRIGRGNNATHDE